MSVSFSLPFSLFLLCFGFDGVPAIAHKRAKTRWGRKLTGQHRCEIKKCNSKQTLFSTVVTHEKHEKDGSIQEGHDLTRGLLIGRVCTGARDTHHILLSLSLHLYQPLSPPSPLFVTLLSSLALSLHPCVSPCLQHLFIVASCRYTAYPLSLPPHFPL